MGNKILLIEDDPFLIEIYTTKFESVGYTVDNAKDGKEGIKKIRETNPSLVLLDIILPEMNGIEVLQSLKEEDEFAKIPVVILSNVGSQDDVEKAMEMGADSYLIKSQYTPSEVVAQVEDMLNNKNNDKN